MTCQRGVLTRVFSRLHLPSTPNTSLFSGYDVDPLLKVNKFTVKKEVFPGKNNSGYLEQGG